MLFDDNLGFFGFAVPKNMKISSDSDSHNVKIKPTDASDNEEELNELLNDEYKKLTMNNDLKTTQDEKLLNYKCELIELMEKQLDTINSIISLK